MEFYDRSQTLAARYDHLKQIEGSDQQESRDKARVTHKLHQLESCLVQLVSKVIENLEAQLQAVIDRRIPIAPNPEGKRKPQPYKTARSYKEIEFEPRAAPLKLEEVEELEKSILEPLDIDSAIDYNPQEIYRSLLSLIQIKLPRSAGQPHLIDLSGIYNVQNGVVQRLRPSRSLPNGLASFQLNEKLYIAGGIQILEKAELPLRDVLSLDRKGKFEELLPLPTARCNLSLTGIANELLALGGYNGDTLKSAESYSTTQELWKKLPSLNFERQWPGSCMLNKTKKYCFCGYDGESLLNSVELLNSEINCSWVVLSLEKRIKPSCHLIGLPIANRILVFGGSDSNSACMYWLDPEGKLLKDLSLLHNIPCFMCHNSAIVFNKKVYFMDSRKEWNWASKARKFDGERILDL